MPENDVNVGVGVCGGRAGQMLHNNFSSSCVSIDIFFSAQRYHSNSFNVLLQHNLRFYSQPLRRLFDRAVLWPQNFARYTNAAKHRVVRHAPHNSHQHILFYYVKWPFRHVFLRTRR